MPGRFVGEVWRYACSASPRLWPSSSVCTNAQRDRTNDAYANTPMLTAAATLSLSGPFALQGRQAARGLELWAASDQVELQIVDDAGSTAKAREAYRGWLGDQVELLLGPYGSGLVRRIGPIVSGNGYLLWNHGGSADHLARQFVVPIPAPASTYFIGAVELAHRRGLGEIVLVRGKGRFASAIVAGARQRATDLGLDVREVDIDEWFSSEPLGDAGVLIVGRFAEDVALVQQIRADHDVGLVGCVAAGLLEFGRRLGAAADEVVAPVQWIANAADPEVGPSGDEFRLNYEDRYGEPPDYVAAQAAAAGHLGSEAHRRQLTHHDVRRWKTTSLLGAFELDEAWRQIGHGPLTIEWRNGRQVQVT